MKNVTKIAKKSAGLSQKCSICPLMRRCTLEIHRACFDSFVEGFKKGARAARKRNKQEIQNRKVMNKIVIEVTSNGWETTATINGKEYKEKHVATAFGSESVEGNFESEDDIPKEIYDALNSSFPFECMQALYSIED